MAGLKVITPGTFISAQNEDDLLEYKSNESLLIPGTFWSMLAHIVLINTLNLFKPLDIISARLPVSNPTLVRSVIFRIITPFQ